MTHKKPLHLPHRSRHVPQAEWVEYPGAILPSWHEIAHDKGFRVVRRVRNRLHLVLECLTCSAHTAHKLFTLRTARPACGGCQATKRQTLAERVGFTLLGRDETHRHYNRYLLPCGHERLLQSGHIERLEQEGATGSAPRYHCPVCFTQKLQAMAGDLDWRLSGNDPDGDANYRLLTHTPCGHRQRVAIGNLETGRFNCGGCGECWSAAPSALYMMRFGVPGLGRFIKLGYSRNPQSRLRYQLGLRRDVEGELIDEVPMPSGQLALKLERALHHQLKADRPDLAIARTELEGWINVTSEIYAAEAEPLIRRMLDTIADQQMGEAPDPAGQPKAP